MMSVAGIACLANIDTPSMAGSARPIPASYVVMISVFVSRHPIPAGKPLMRTVVTGARQGD